MGKQRKSLFKKKKVDKDNLFRDSVTSKRESSNNVSTTNSRKTMEMQDNVFGKDKPSIFETINYINTLIENSG